MFQNESLIGKAFYHQKTKKLIEFIPTNSIAVLNHKDIDRISTERLIEKQVKAVINCHTSFSGEYLSKGTRMLLEANVAVVDLKTPEAFLKLFQNGDMLELTEKGIILRKLTKSIPFEMKQIYTIEELYRAEHGLTEKGIIDKSTIDFIDNTLLYAQMEQSQLQARVELPQAVRALSNRYVVIVTRGFKALNELQQLEEIIRHVKPFIIGVDGGADIALNAGIEPHVIFGDMDSVSENALLCGASLIVHAYTNREAPGEKTLKSADLGYQLFPCFGTSEDAAILMAYYAGAKKIISVGSHKNILDYQEKNRQGMGSTLLTRLLVGEKLVDARDFAELATLKAEAQVNLPVMAAINRTFKRTWAQVLENGPY